MRSQQRVGKKTTTGNDIYKIRNEPRICVKRVIISFYQQTLFDSPFWVSCPTLLESQRNIISTFKSRAVLSVGCWPTDTDANKVGWGSIALLARNRHNTVHLKIKINHQ